MTPELTIVTSKEGENAVIASPAGGTTAITPNRYLTDIRSDTKPVNMAEIKHNLYVSLHQSTEDRMSL